MLRFVVLNTAMFQAGYVEYFDAREASEQIEYVYEREMSHRADAAESCERGMHWQTAFPLEQQMRRAGPLYTFITFELLQVVPEHLNECSEVN